MAALVAAVRNTPSIRCSKAMSPKRWSRRTAASPASCRAAMPGAAPLVRTFAARAVVLATGGIGHLYAVTTNPPEANGDGLAMAARAGALIADPEFVQFHPTAIDIGRDPAPLATEALRGDGATLINRAGERFMLAIHPDAELAPRDIVARGVFAEIAAGRGAFLDAATAIGREFSERFPDRLCRLRSGRHRPGDAADPGRAGRALPHGRHLHGRSRPHLAARPVGCRRGRLDRRARRQPAGLELAARSRGVRRAHRQTIAVSETLPHARTIATRVAGQRRAIAGSPTRTDVEMRQPTETDHDRACRRHPRRRRPAHARLREIIAIERDAGTAALRNMAPTALLVAASASLAARAAAATIRSDYPDARSRLAHRSRAAPLARRAGSPKARWRRVSS